MSKQYGFYYDAGRCIQCRTCEVACKSTHNTEPGVKWRRVVETWGGEYPSVTRAFFSLACMHCEKPACAAVCPTGAIIKRAEDGIVVVDRAKCNGCQDCLSACPYGVPQFGGDGTMQKCDYCVETGREPACAVSCPAEALNFGTLDELLKMATGKAIKRMDGTTQPSLIIVR
jgi:anaerobic dimethyl sulfoxide reductase subunit B (iron-sulfur subunit)